MVWSNVFLAASNYCRGGEGRINRVCGKKFVGGVRQGGGDSPDEKIFTPTDERGFLPYTPHPTPYTLFKVRRLFLFILPTPHTPHPVPRKNFFSKP
jgi:hypothetical protein